LDLLPKVRERDAMRNELCKARIIGVYNRRMNQQPLMLGHLVRRSMEVVEKPPKEVGTKWGSTIQYKKELFSSTYKMLTLLGKEIMLVRWTILYTMHGSPLKEILIL